MDCSPPGSSVRGILQAGILEGFFHFLLQGIFPTQGWDLCLRHCRHLLSPLSHQGSPYNHNEIAPNTQRQGLLVKRQTVRSGSEDAAGTDVIHGAFPGVCAESRATVWDPMEPVRLLCSWDFPGKNTGVGCFSFSRGSSQPRDQIHISYSYKQIYQKVLSSFIPKITPNWKPLQWSPIRT